MKQKKLVGSDLIEDWKFCALVEEIKNTEGVTILKEAENFEIIECEYGRFHNWQPTGKVHVGYDLRYIQFLYKGMVFYVQPEEFHGGFYFVPYKVTEKRKFSQAGYAMNYTGMESINEYLGINRYARTIAGGGTGKSEIDLF